MPKDRAPARRDHVDDFLDTLDVPGLDPVVEGIVDRIQEDVAVALPASAPAQLRGRVLYDLACLYCRDGRPDDARDTLGDAVRLAPALAATAPADADLAPLFAPGA